MSDKIFCPWCGTEMEIKTVEHHGADSFLYPEEGRKPLWNAWTNCLNYNCEAEGPIVVEFESEQEAIKAARAAALRRYTPPLKPMTLEEATERRSVWYEKIGFEPREIREYGLGLTPPRENYGVTWRCWLHKPTDEERNAVEWEK